MGSELVAVPSRDSDNSSGHSTPEVRHRGAVSSHPKGAGGGLDPTRPHSQALDNPLYANLEHVSNVCMCLVASNWCYVMVQYVHMVLSFVGCVCVCMCVCVCVYKSDEGTAN